MVEISEVEGIGKAYAARLVEAGIETISELYHRCSTLEGRKEIAVETGISLKRIRKWVTSLDRLLVIGIKPKYDDLLAATGIDSLSKLADQDPLDLYETMIEVNKGKKYIKKVPSPRRVENWIKAANGLPKVETDWDI